MTTVAASKTREDVEALKRDWANDPCYDITGIEGFEQFEAELVAFEQEQQARWAAQRAAAEAQAAVRVLVKAEELGIPGNTALAGYVLALERRVAQIEARLDNE